MQATVKILDWIEMPTPELIPILHQGAILRLPYLESRLEEARTQVETFQNKYTTTFAQLNARGLPDNASYEMHEDFIEWEYWTEVAQQTTAALQNVELILAKIEDSAGVAAG